MITRPPWVTTVFKTRLSNRPSNAASSTRSMVRDRRVNPEMSMNPPPRSGCRRARPGRQARRCQGRAPEEWRPAWESRTRPRTRPDSWAVKPRKPPATPPTTMTSRTRAKVIRLRATEASRRASQGPVQRLIHPATGRPRTQPRTPDAGSAPLTRRGRAAPVGSFRAIRPPQPPLTGDERPG